jgi:hypothetical protein
MGRQRCIAGSVDSPAELVDAFRLEVVYRLCTRPRIVFKELSINTMADEVAVSSFLCCAKGSIAEAPSGRRNRLLKLHRVAALRLGHWLSCALNEESRRISLSASSP